MIERMYSIGRNYASIQISYLFQVIAEFHGLKHASFEVVMRDEQEQAHKQIYKADDEVGEPGEEDVARAPELAFDKDHYL